MAAVHTLDPAAGGPGDHLEAPPGPARDAGSWPAWVRWRFMAFLICFLILFTSGQVGVQITPRDTEPHNTMIGVSWLGIVGALLFLVLLKRARHQFSGAQVGWAMVPLMSLGFVAFVPFLWLALVCRRVRDWVVFAV